MSDSQGRAGSLLIVPRTGRLCLIAALALLLLATAADGCLAGLLLVHNELGVAFFAIPLEACQVGCLKLVIGLDENQHILIKGKLDNGDKPSS